MTGVTDSFASALRLFHTVRYLRPIQIWSRLRPKRRLDLRHPVSTLRKVTGRWAQPCQSDPALIASQRHIYLNQTAEISKASHWNDPSKPLLWLYNLHYFADLNATHAEQREQWHRQLIAKWVEENPPDKGVGWEPFPTSLRIVNWVKWALAGNDLDPEWHRSLGLQARSLRQSLEYHLLGNHLFANAKALIFAGCFFCGKEADEWLAKGLSLLQSELSEQILPDGGHFELSPMYQLICIEDVLDLINLSAAYPEAIAADHRDDWACSAAKMMEWSAAMSHPDGGLAYFNDAAMGIAPTLFQLVGYRERILGARDLKAPSFTHLTASGFVRLEQDEMAALLDVGPIGASYIPGHGHADTLSFEMSVLGQRVIVNTGTSTYDPGERRAYERSTAAHSTVEIDRENSSEVWHNFRVARRAKPTAQAVEATDNGAKISCSHDGYRRLKGRPVHTRTWLLEGRQLAVTDRIAGAYRIALSRFHLHPDIKAIPMDDRALRLEKPGGFSIRMEIDGASYRVYPSHWCAEFGLTHASEVIVLELNEQEYSARFIW